MNWLDLPLTKYARGNIRLPGSKSISNRILLLAALSSGETDIHDLLASDDTTRMLEALNQLGVPIAQTGEHDYRITGQNGKFPVTSADLFLGNAGTAFRPLAAVLSLMNGQYRLSGVPRMHERPIGDLVDALRQLGATLSYLGHEGFPPLHIEPFTPRNEQSINKVTVKGNASSQFLTGLLIALPLTQKNLSFMLLANSFPSLMSLLPSRNYNISVYKSKIKIGNHFAYLLHRSIDRQDRFLSKAMLLPPPIF